MKFDLEERLIEYSVLILDIVENTPDSKGANHLTSQLVRSGTAPALVYSEACGAESRKDFIHKMKIGLKELREKLTCLKVIHRKQYVGSSGESKLTKALDESNELIAIFVKSIKTAMKIWSGMRLQDLGDRFYSIGSSFNIQYSLFNIRYSHLNYETEISRRPCQPDSFGLGEQHSKYYGGNIPCEGERI